MGACAAAERLELRSLRAAHHFTTFIIQASLLCAHGTLFFIAAAAGRKTKRQACHARPSPGLPL